MSTSGPDAPTPRLATAEDRPAVVETVTEAFRADPAFRFFFPSDESYAEEVADFAGRLFDQRQGKGAVWVLEGGAAVAMWEPPGISTGSLEGALRPDAMARMRRWDKATHALLPSERQWYLGVLAVHPDHARKGWGRLVMSPGLERAQADGLPAYLETSTEVNAGIYGRYGWRDVGRGDVEGIPLIVMRLG